MAVKNIKNYTAGDGYGSPLNIRRGNPNPLDNTYLWATFAEAALYAATNPVAYVGQLVAAYEEKDGHQIVCLYIIYDEKGTLLPIVSQTASGSPEQDLAEIKTQIGVIQQQQEEDKKKQEEIIQKQEELEQKHEEVAQKQQETEQKQQEIIQKQEETEQKQQEIIQKQEETTQKQEEIIKKQEETEKTQQEIQQKQEEIEKKQEEVQKELEQNISETVNKVVEEQQKENEAQKQQTESIKTDIGQTTDPETGESKLPENAEDIVDAINKVNDKIVDPREDEDQWATEEDIDDLYSDLFAGLGW